MNGSNAYKLVEQALSILISDSERQYLIKIVKSDESIAMVTSKICVYFLIEIVNTVKYLPTKNPISYF